MYDLKQNFLSEEWVFYSSARSKRPQQFEEKNNNEDIKADSIKNCPFCLKNIHMTEDEILVSDDKRVRLIPNKYPAIIHSNNMKSGVHDVLIDTSEHFERLYDFSIENIMEIFSIIKKRILMLKMDEKIKYVQVFKNEGNRAGASIFHSHFQIIGVPEVLSKQKTMSKNFKKYYNMHKSCYLCDEIEKVLENESLLVFQNKDFIAYSPEVSIFTNGISIAPKFHVYDFTKMSDENFYNLSSILKIILKGYSKKFKDFNYNLSFQLTPFGEEYKYNHFFMEIIPRSSTMAGFEFSTGSFINSVFPEDFAKEFRSEYL